MSIYSGFPTRNQETQYYRLLENLIFLLQSRVLLSLKSQSRPTDISWSKKFTSVYSSLKSLELHKYLEPKLSESCRDLANHFSMDPSTDPIFSDLGSPKMSHLKLTSSTKFQTTPRKKQQIKPRNKSERHKVTNQSLGMSQYYGKIMDNFLSKPDSLSLKKKMNHETSLDNQDFWLLDDRIKVIDNETKYNYPSDSFY
jgi:hypothetical protein